MSNNESTINNDLLIECKYFRKYPIENTSEIIEKIKAELSQLITDFNKSNQEQEIFVEKSNLSIYPIILVDTFPDSQYSYFYKFNCCWNISLEKTIFNSQKFKDDFKQLFSETFDNFEDGTIKINSISYVV